MTIGREPGDSTMIRVSWETKEELNALKEGPENKKEAIGDVVKRILHENKVLQTEKSALLKQIQMLSMPNIPVKPQGPMPIQMPYPQNSEFIKFIPAEPEKGEMPK